MLHCLALPAPLDAIPAFISHLFVLGFSASTICSHLSAIAYRHQLASERDPTQTFLVRRMTMGCKKHRSVPDSRLPLLLTQVHALYRSCTALYVGLYEIALYQALFLFIYHGFFRVGEVLPHSLSSAHRIIQYADISFPGDKLCVSLKHHKTQTTGHATSIFISPTRNAYCPCVVLRRYIELRGTVSGPLFIDCMGRTVTFAKFRSVLSTSLAFLQLPTDLYTPHSFRIGACTQAVMLGVSTDKVQAMGRWRSRAYQRYIRLPCQS